MVGSFNHRRLLESIRNIPMAKLEKNTMPCCTISQWHCNLNHIASNNHKTVHYEIRISTDRFVILPLAIIWSPN